MINNVTTKSNRVHRLFREQFTFQISVDTSPRASRGSRVAGAALAGGVTIVELGTPLLENEGVRTSCQPSGSSFPTALLLADMKTMDGGDVEARAV